MAKSTRKRAKSKITTKKAKKVTTSQRVAEHVDYLLELHRLQGLLLTRLRKEIKKVNIV